jgi:hypothetical protein
MNPVTRKLIIPLHSQESTQSMVPLKRLYVLNHPRSGASPNGKVRIRRLSPRRAVPALLEHTFNDLIHETERLAPQFLQYSEIASQVPVKLLSYPRRLDALESVRDAILRDLRR